MQVKIVIGTIAFMLTMIVMGFVSLQEPARMEAYTAAFHGRAVENGAAIFTSNCAGCHGIEGKAEQCFNGDEQIGCAGRPLNNAELVCGSTSARMEQLGWGGTKYDFVRSTVLAGRPWAGMPTWGQEFGGPLQDDQVKDVSHFVLNWESEELCDPANAAPTTDWSAIAAGDLPAGDAANGEELYNITYGCTACHGNPDEAGSAAVGPWLGEISTAYTDRGDYASAADYIMESVLDPNAVIAPDCPSGPCPSPSSMPGTFGARMNPQEMADIIEYLTNR